MASPRAIAWRPIGVACAGAFVAALSTSVVAVSIPVIAADLGVTRASASWVLSAYLLAASCLLALSGRAADLFGRKRIYLTGFAFFVAASAMCAAAPTFEALVGARIMQGAGAAMLMAVGPAIVTRSVPPDRRARALGIQLAATYTGLTLGPGVGGALATSLGWHAVFVVVAVAGVAAAAIALVALPADASDEATLGRESFAKLDLSGALFLAVALGALLVAVRRGGDQGFASVPVLAIAALAAVAFWGFARREAAHPSPLLPLGLLRKRPFAFGVAGATLLYTITFMLAFLLPFHLQRELHMSPRGAGLLMTAQPAVMAVVAPTSGWIADRWGARLPTTAGMLAIAAGMAAVAASPSSVVGLAVVGFGAGLYVAPNNAVIMGAAARERQGTAAAMAATARNVGMALGSAVSASLARPLGFAHTMQIAAGLALVGGLLAVSRGK